MLAIPASEIVNVITVSQALIGVVAVAISPLRKTLPGRALGLVLLIFALIKADQIYQFMDGPAQAPQLAFWLSPLEWLMTPALFFYVVALSTPGFRFAPRDLVHLLPATLWLTWQSATFLFLTDAQKLDFLASGVLRDPLHALWIPLFSAAFQLAYVAAAVRRLRRHGQSLRQWFSSVEDRDLKWVRNLLVLWVSIILVHLVFVIARQVMEPGPWARLFVDALNLAHMVFAIALVFRGLAHPLLVPDAKTPAPAIGKYAQSTLSAAERDGLFERAHAAMTERELFRNGDLSLDDLAADLDATERELSEAINGSGGVRFYEFVNGFRIEAASEALLAEPDRAVLEIALEAGFNSKSTFNALFKAHTAMTPSQFRTSKRP